mmetsp:Transcript_64902/g.201041  ORF Transcript_64902/g.201041 Transcript_64902/m.201041 type:complete len:265 (+) Transcript_64902:75-869(+)
MEGRSSLLQRQAPRGVSRGGLAVLQIFAGGRAGLQHSNVDDVGLRRRGGDARRTRAHDKQERRHGCDIQGLRRWVPQLACRAKAEGVCDPRRACMDFGSLPLRASADSPRCVFLQIGTNFSMCTRRCMQDPACAHSWLCMTRQAHSALGRAAIGDGCGRAQTHEPTAAWTIPAHAIRACLGLPGTGEGRHHSETVVVWQYRCPRAWGCAACEVVPAFLPFTEECLYLQRVVGHLLMAAWLRRLILLHRVVDGAAISHHASWIWL